MRRRPGLPAPDTDTRRARSPLWRSARRAVWLWSRVSERAHQAALLAFSWWPLGLLPPRRRAPHGTRRIAYYTWHFPVLSQTFVHRELVGLRQAGVHVDIVADDPEDLTVVDDNARELLGDVRYLNPVEPRVLARYRRFFFATRPLTSLNLLVYVLTHQYGPYKSPGEDWRVFQRAILLAGVLRDLRIDHVHAPWADRSAFLAMLASRLLRVPYSVQARAHEIHRHSYLFGLRERFERAEFIVTNTEYNRRRISELVGARHRGRISVIHNGIDLHRFAPGTFQDHRPVRLLTVARLIEQKGLTDLLHACQRMRAAGVPFRCDIIGGPEHPLYTNYLVALRKLHRRLGLEEWVHFHGSQPLQRVLDAYADADIFVLPCVIAADGSRDITPNSLIEAMAMKLPVVSTPVTGIPEIVDDGVDGILVPAHDDAALARALIALAADPARRRRLGEQARIKVERKFDLARNTARYAALFSEGRRAEDLDPPRVLQLHEKLIRLEPPAIEQRPDVVVVDHEELGHRPERPAQPGVDAH